MFDETPRRRRQVVRRLGGSVRGSDAHVSTRSAHLYFEIASGTRGCAAMLRVPRHCCQSTSLDSRFQGPCFCAEPAEPRHLAGHTLRGLFQVCLERVIRHDGHFKCSSSNFILVHSARPRNGETYVAAGPGGDKVWTLLGMVEGLFDLDRENLTGISAQASPLGPSLRLW